MCKANLVLQHTSTVYQELSVICSFKDYKPLVSLLKIMFFAIILFFPFFFPIHQGTVSTALDASSLREKKIHTF